MNAIALAPVAGEILGQYTISRDLHQINDLYFDTPRAAAEHIDQHFAEQNAETPFFVQTDDFEIVALVYCGVLYYPAPEGERAAD